MNSDREALKVNITSSGYLLDEDNLSPKEDIILIKPIPK